MKHVTQKLWIFWAIIAVVLVGLFLNGPWRYTNGHAFEIACSTNLSAIHKHLFVLAQKERLLPLKKDNSVENGSTNSLELLNSILNSPFMKDVEPETFVCPASQQRVAERDETGRFVLTEETCSYEILPPGLQVGKRRLLAYCRCSNHGGARLVVDSSGAVREVEEERFQGYLKRQGKAGGGAD